MRATCRLLTLLALLTSAPAAAQDLNNQSAENYEQLWFVPYLGGAVSFEGGLMQPIRLGISSDFPTTWFAGAGYKYYLEGHGRRQLRLMATFEHGGVLNPAVEGTANRLGASFGFTLRGISQQWFFGQLTALVEAGYVTLRPPDHPFEGRQRADNGYEFGFGVETTFGSMFMLDPYLMAETGAQVTVNRVVIGPLETWEIWGRWVVRFDLGVRDASRGLGNAPSDWKPTRDPRTNYSSPTVSRP